MYLLGLASVFCILFIYKKLLLNCRLSTELSLLQQEEYSLNQYVEETKTRYEKTKSFRHDIKNHIAVVKKLLQSGKLEEAVSYMEDMDDMAEKMSFPCSTNNPVVDILVGNKLGIAKSMGIDINGSLLLSTPAVCGISIFVLSCQTFWITQFMHVRVWMAIHRNISMCAGAYREIYF